MSRRQIALIFFGVVLASPIFATNLALAQSDARNGQRLEQAGDLKGAIAKYTAALQKARAGSAQDKQLREKIIDLALKLDPKPTLPEDAVKHGVRGETLAKVAQTDADRSQAAAEYRVALKLAPWWADAYLNYGLLEEATHHPADAAFAYTFYLHAAPNAPDAEEVQKRIYAQQALAEKSIQPPLAAGKIAPKSVTRTSPQSAAATNKGVPDLKQCLEDRNSAAAIAACTAIIETEPGFSQDDAYGIAYGIADVLDARGWRYLRETGQIDLALNDFDHAIKLKPDDAYLYSHRGDAHFRAGEYQLAIADFSMAIQLIPINPRFFVTRSKAYSAERLYDDAMRDLNQAVRMTATHPMPDPLPYCERGKLEMRIGNVTAGNTDMARAVQLARGLDPCE